MPSAATDPRLARVLAGTASLKPLALLRIGTAAIALWQAAVFWIYRDILAVPTALVAWPVSESFVLPGWPTLGGVARLLAPLGLGGEQALAVVLLLHAVGAAFMLAGLFTRPAAVVAWLTYLPLRNTLYFTLYGIGGMLLIALFYCAVLPVAREWSLDARRRPPPPRTDDPWLKALPVMVLRLHMCIVYAAAGLSKAIGPQWWNGEAVWRALSLPQFRQFDPTPLLSAPGLLVLASVTATLVQLAYPVLVWTRARALIVLVTELLHLGIAIFLGLWMFSAMMMVLNLGAWGESLWRAIARREAVEPR